MIQYLQELLDSSSTPLLTAFLLRNIDSYKPLPFGNKYNGNGIHKQKY